MTNNHQKIADLKAQLKAALSEPEPESWGMSEGECVGHQDGFDDSIHEMEEEIHELVIEDEVSSIRSDSELSSSIRELFEDNDAVELFVRLMAASQGNEDTYDIVESIGNKMELDGEPDYDYYNDGW